MKVTIENIPSCTIVYMRQIGPYGIANSQLMDTFKRWAASTSIFNTMSVILGIAQDNPAFVKPEHCRYDACLVVPEDYCVQSDEVSLGSISGGSYAVFMIPHTAEAVQKAWGEIFTELKNRRLSLDETRPILERYSMELVSNHYCEICVPLH
ncbi:DNA gyrase inhibitor [Paenibacillus sp. P3E]|uniref:AraC family transcriptional regulator n=1 Tax=unclassified Paenibacillus TaxID=185978 RepID=UPI00093C585F|nr:MULTISPECIES: GyrI-like domain-containing protein [unclassified Paenibacillus]OKP76028.1 DNA gyrase inhibitor [Paenibacillus sp. P3E]OKP84353.1 DNA gyrase inhibitor [Paenibacillus sp. P32E]